MNEHVAVRKTASPTLPSAPDAQANRAVRPRPGPHQGDDPACQQGPGVPRGGPSGRGSHARQGRRRARGSAAVLCGGYAGDAAVGDWGEWGREVRWPHFEAKVDLTLLLFVYHGYYF